MDDTVASGDFDFMSDQILEDIIPGLDAGMASPLDILAFPPLDGLSDNSSIHGEASLDAGTPLDCMACTSIYQYTPVGFILTLS